MISRRCSTARAHASSSVVVLLPYPVPLSGGPPPPLTSVRPLPRSGTGSIPPTKKPRLKIAGRSEGEAVEAEEGQLEETPSAKRVDAEFGALLEQMHKAQADKARRPDPGSPGLSEILSCALCLVGGSF